MTNNIETFKQKISTAKIAVLGLGISNIPLIRFLYNSGARNITAYDKFSNPKIIETIENLKAQGMICRAVTGDDYLEDIPKCSYDIIFKSPIIRPDSPSLIKAVEGGALLTSEMELFFELCPCKIYGITGSDGKTTTTTLTYKLLSAHYQETETKVFLGGNIGRPLIDFLPEIRQQDVAVLELSSFQLMTMKKSPNVSVITNITPNHLDVHKDYDEYIDAKKNILKYCQEDSVAVLNDKNPITAAIASELIAKGRRVRLFSVYKQKAEFTAGAEGYGMPEGDLLVFATQAGEAEKMFVLPEEKVRVPGLFNRENFLAAIAACADVITQSDIEAVASEFAGVSHRCELVREIDGVKYYNSSIDSSPNRTIQTLSVFKGDVVMIAGGKDKNIPYDEIGPVICDKVKVLILIGPTAEKIESAVKACELYDDKKIQIFHPETYAEAVKTAYSNAKKGDCVLLSPASTSFDRFKNFEERGNIFKDLVNSL